MLLSAGHTEQFFGLKFQWNFR